MNNYLYTYLDDFEVLHHGNVVAESVDYAKVNILQRYGDKVAVEIWDKSKCCLEKGDFWSWGNRFYLGLRTSKNKLVYVYPILYLLCRLVFIFCMIGSIVATDILAFSIFSFFFLMTFLHSTKFIVQRDHIFYRKRILYKKKEDRIDISNSAKIIFKGKEFGSDRGRKQLYFFIYIEKDGTEILVYGNNLMQTTKRMAKKISEFLGLPLVICEENGNV
jgi:hypothetical protein